ncbi:hypothetical protein Pelo_17056 [Pelomyxa schiedti]|nr:hypothetical protein Pelo_17056 [Pelomyxa schiedti]
MVAYIEEIIQCGALIPLGHYQISLKTQPSKRHSMELGNILSQRIISVRRLIFSSAIISTSCGMFSTTDVEMKTACCFAM